MHMIFIDLEKVYDKVPRNIMWWALQNHKVSSKYITLIKDMYNNVVQVFEQVTETLMTFQLI
jgi:hypothetical protein